MVTIQHPAVVLNRGQPARASVGGDNYDIDEDGYLAVDDDARAAEVMDRLADTYGVTYTDDGEIETDDATAAITEVDESPAGDGEQDTAADSAAADDADTDTDTDTDADTEGYDRAALEAKDMDDLRDLLEDVGGDTDAIDARKKDEVVAAILRRQADGIDTAEGDADAAE